MGKFCEIQRKNRGGGKFIDTYFSHVGTGGIFANVVLDVAGQRGQEIGVHFIDAEVERSVLVDNRVVGSVEQNFHFLYQRACRYGLGEKREWKK